MATFNLNEACFELSECVAELGVGCNSRRVAQEYFSMLIEACGDIGGGVRAINCLPARSMRIRQTEELIKLTTKVIYLLESALHQQLFPANLTKDALSMAIAISESLGEFVSAYCVKPIPVTMPVNVNMPDAQPLAADGIKAAVSVQNDDPDGFNQKYTGKI